MSTTLLLAQFAAHNIALFCAALYAGAAVYVSLVEHPTMMAGGAELADTYVLTSHPRPVIVHTSFGVLGATAGLVAGIAGGQPWWIAGGVLLGAAAAVHVLYEVPLTRRCLEIDPRTELDRARATFTRLVRLHAALSLAGLASLSIFILAA